MVINPPKNQLQVFKKSLILMGNRFELSAVALNQEIADAQIESGILEIQRIERLLTTYKEDSQTNEINRNAGIKPVKVDQEVFNLIARSIKISEITQGAFDITYGSIDKSLWNFDVNMKKLPDAETAKKAIRLINYKNIILDYANTTVFLKEEGMRIGFGGIGKGYAADSAKMVMKENGCQSGIVNASGDLNVWGTQPDGSDWTVGVVNPNVQGEAFSYMSVTGLAIATSGNYEKYAVIDGKKYSHTISPKTGLPVSGIKSVTIITKSAEVADAMATPVMIMGIDTGMDLINQLKDIEAIIIDDNNNIYTTKNINLR